MSTVDDPPARTSERALRRAAVAERERLALELVVAGRTYADIADTLDVSPTQAGLIVGRALAKRAEDFRQTGTYEQARVIWIDRLNRLLSSWWEPATTGQDIKAAEFVLKVLDKQGRALAIGAGSDEDPAGLPDADQLRHRQAAILAELEALGERVQRNREAIEGEYTVTGDDE